MDIAAEDSLVDMPVGDIEDNLEDMLEWDSLEERLEADTSFQASCPASVGFASSRLAASGPFAA